MNEFNSDFCRKSYEYGKIALDDWPLTHTGLAWSREVVGMLTAAVTGQTADGILTIRRVFQDDFLNSLYCGLDKEILIRPHEHWDSNLYDRLNSAGDFNGNEVQAEMRGLLADTLESFVIICGASKESEGNIFFSTDVPPVQASSNSVINDVDWWRFKHHLYVNGLLPLEIKEKAVFAMIDRLRGKPVQSILEEYGTEFEWLFPKIGQNPLVEKMTEELKARLSDIQSQMYDSFNRQEYDFENQRKALEAEQESKRNELKRMYMNIATDVGMQFGDTLEAGGSWFAEPIREGAAEWASQALNIQWAVRSGEGMNYHFPEGMEQRAYHI